MNLIAVAHSKLAEMANTLQASGGDARPPMKGEFGYLGGVIEQSVSGCWRRSAEAPARMITGQPEAALTSISTS